MSVKFSQEKRLPRQMDERYRMREPANIFVQNDLFVQTLSARAAAVLTTCTNRKSVRPAREATAVSLPKGQQPEVETAWRDRLKTLPLACSAGSLYAGRAIKLGHQAAKCSGAALYIVSAGLGLVAGERNVPTYGLTVSGLGPESVAQRSVGCLNSAAWWRSVSSGPYSTRLASLFADDTQLPILIALTQQYAKLIAEALDALDDVEVRRLRIVGIGLDNHLPERVSRQVLPYDERLERVMPGTGVDFAQRALLHFADGGLRERPAVDVVGHSDWVASSLSGLSAPVRPIRARLSDGDIAVIIERSLPKNPGVSRLLRLLRDQEGVACEQGRFARIYREVVERRSA